MEKVLIIVPYEHIYPPMNGGMQRCFHIIHQLAKYFELTAIIHQDKESFLKSGEEYPAINNIKIYSTTDESGTKDIFSLVQTKYENALRYRWYKKSIKGPADSNFLKYYPVLKKVLKEHLFDVVVLENLSTLNAIDTIRKYGKRTKIIYDAHNVDSKLGKVAVEKFGMKKEYLAGMKKAESSLYRTVNAVFACSEQDRKDFIVMNKKKIPVGVIPNGINAGNLYNGSVMQENPGYILFCGALWSRPNSEGLLWFYNNIWPEVKKILPQLKLFVVGSGHPPESFQPLLNDSSLVFTGAVDDVRPWYNEAAVAIVPLLSGSGTRLKILEAMGYGLPVISTSKGAEGIEYTDGENILIADNENLFSEKIITLLKDKGQRLFIQQNGRKLAEEKYDWNLIGKKIVEFINDEFMRNDD